MASPHDGQSMIASSIIVAGEWRSSYPATAAVGGGEVDVVERRGHGEREGQAEEVNDRRQIAAQSVEQQHDAGGRDLARRGQLAEQRRVEDAPPEGEVD